MCAPADDLELLQADHGDVRLGGVRAPGRRLPGARGGHGGVVHVERADHPPAPLPVDEQTAPGEAGHRFEPGYRRGAERLDEQVRVGGGELDAGGAHATARSRRLHRVEDGRLVVLDGDGARERLQQRPAPLAHHLIAVAPGRLGAPPAHREQFAELPVDDDVGTPVLGAFFEQFAPLVVQHPDGSLGLRRITGHVHRAHEHGPSPPRSHRSHRSNPARLLCEYPECSAPPVFRSGLIAAICKKSSM